MTAHVVEESADHDRRDTQQAGMGCDSCCCWFRCGNGQDSSRLELIGIVDAIAKRTCITPCLRISTYAVLWSGFLMMFSDEVIRHCALFTGGVSIRRHR